METDLAPTLEARVVAGIMVTTNGSYEDEDRWSMRHYSLELGRVIGALMIAGDAFLLGRTTYEMLRGEFEDAAGPTADLINGRPKYVVTSAPETLSWRNSHALDPAAIVDAVRDLKKRHQGNINVTGSGQLLSLLLDEKLVDELHFFVFPIVWNSGKKIPSGIGGEDWLGLRKSETLPHGVIHLEYTRSAPGDTVSAEDK